jgi:hypothetical protein
MTMQAKGRQLFTGDQATMEEVCYAISGTGQRQPAWLRAPHTFQRVYGSTEKQALLPDTDWWTIRSTVRQDGRAVRGLHALA